MEGGRAIAVAAVVAAALAAASPAAAAPTTFVLTFGPVEIAPYSVAQSTAPTAAPNVDGYVVGMRVDVVDSQGRVVPDERVMLHHAVFAKLGASDTTCPRLGLPLGIERFYGSGEERNVLALPAGFGYPNRSTDRWGLVYMLMNHGPRPDKVWIRYHVDYEAEVPLTPVKPLWLDVRNCRLDPVFDVPGSGGPGSLFRSSWEFTLPEGGWLVAGTGHLHGGGVRLDLSDATCGRPLFTSEPSWAAPGTDEYAIRPVLHEPGPVHMSGFTAEAGIPVAAGSVLRLEAVYANDLPHTRAMGIMGAFLAPGPVEGCQPLPALAIDRGAPGPPPRFIVPLPREPRGKVVRNPRRPVVVKEFSFSPERISLRRGATLRWRFAGFLQHNLTVVGGPVGFSSESTTAGVFSHRFTRRGVYKLVCSLHPAQMTQIVTVR